MWENNYYIVARTQVVRDSEEPLVWNNSKRHVSYQPQFILF